MRNGLNTNQGMNYSLENFAPTNGTTYYPGINQMDPDLARKWVEGWLRISEDCAKTDYANERSLETYKRRLAIRDDHREAERAIIEVVEVDDTGNLYLLTKNTVVDAKPRWVSNMTSPAIVKITNGTREFCCFLLTCKIADKVVKIFLSPEKISRGDYLKNKLLNEGVIFRAGSAEKEKRLLQDLLARLIRDCTCEVVVPDREGWYKDGENFIHVEKGGFTWKCVEMLMK